MMRERFSIALLLGCLCFAATGCQWALSIQPGDVMVQPGKPVEIKIIAERTLDTRSANAVLVRSFKPSTPIHIRFSSGETWTQPSIKKIDPYHYVYTFRGIINAPTQYFVDPHGPIVRSAGKGAGPYDVAMEPNVPMSNPYEEGQRFGRDHIAGETPTYQLVIALRDGRLSASDRETFLKGFLWAYQNAGSTAEGRKYTDVIRDAIVGSAFGQARQDGIRHANNQINDAYVQNLIGAAGGSGAAALAWKAGYIDGFAVSLLAKNAAVDHRDAIRQAETMYNSLKRGTGL